MEPWTSRPQLPKCFPKSLRWKSFLYFLKKASDFVETETPKKSLYLTKRNDSYISGSNFSTSKIFYAFSYKDTKFSKLKNFLMIIIWHIFFYTQQAFVFSFLRDFSNVHNHVVFFCFFFRRTLILFTSFLCSLSLFSWQYLADKF